MICACVYVSREMGWAPETAVPVTPQALGGDECV